MDLWSSWRHSFCGECKLYIKRLWVTPTNSITVWFVSWSVDEPVSGPLHDPLRHDWEPSLWFVFFPGFWLLCGVETAPSVMNPGVLPWRCLLPSPCAACLLSSSPSPFLISVLTPLLPPTAGRTLNSLITSHSSNGLLTMLTLFCRDSIIGLR